MCPDRVRFLLFAIGSWPIDGRQPEIPDAGPHDGCNAAHDRSAVIIGYVLNFRIYFEAEYLATGLVWMSLPTAIGMTLLGVGVWVFCFATDKTSTRPRQTYGLRNSIAQPHRVGGNCSRHRCGRSGVS